MGYYYPGKHYPDPPLWTLFVFTAAMVALLVALQW